MSLWQTPERSAWIAALDGYEAVVARQGVAVLPELDRWYRAELPGRIEGRDPPRVTREDLVRLTEWKMARGVWRARNLALVRANPAAEVEEASARAIEAVPDPRAPITGLAKLSGVGPATASAVVSAVAPGIYPFFDEIVADQVPGLGPVAFTLPYYIRYADALRKRSATLGEGWTPADVERALWSAAGGKAGPADR
jgi:hypothetical protein